MHSKWDRIISALVTWIKNISWVSEAKRGRYELIQVTYAEIILSHFEGIWWYFSHTFHYFMDEISWKYEKTCQSGTWMSAPLICARLRSQHVDYAHHVSYMCTPCAWDVGDVRSAFIQFHICEVMRWLSHTWSGWDVFWEVHRITWLFSQKVWESNLFPMVPWHLSFITVLQIHSTKSNLSNSLCLGSLNLCNRCWCTVVSLRLRLAYLSTLATCNVSGIYHDSLT